MTHRRSRLSAFTSWFTDLMTPPARVRLVPALTIVRHPLRSALSPLPNTHPPGRAAGAVDNGAMPVDPEF